MFRSAILVSFALFALVVAAPQDPQTEFLNINSRVPGDQLIWQSSFSQQKLDFFGQNTYEISYPLNGSRGDYIITHIHVDAKETTGFMDVNVYGGIGQDFARIRLISKSVKTGSYKIFIYGKKK